MGAPPPTVTPPTSTGTVLLLCTGITLVSSYGQPPDWHRQGASENLPEPQERSKRRLPAEPPLAQGVQGDGSSRRLE